MMFVARHLYRTLVFLHFVVFFLFLIWFVLAVWSRYHVYQKCIALPNGVMVGRTALFDPGALFSRQGRSFHSRMILKLPDGSPLVRDEVFPIYVTETTVYGRAESSSWSARSYGFAYRPDAGLVYEDVDPEAYARLEQEAGELLDFLFDSYDRRAFGENGEFSRGSNGKFVIKPDGDAPIADQERTFVHMDLPVAYDRLRRDPSFLRRNCNVSVFPQ